MDACRILFRSTNLSSKASPNDPKSMTPSAGAAINPRLFGDNIAYEKQQSSATHANTASTSQKRKRSQGNAVETSPVTRSLDFFEARADRSSRPRPANNNVLSDKTKNLNSNSRVSETQLETSKVDSEMAEVERKQILRAHKVKIIKLWGQENAVAQRRTQKRRRVMEGEAVEEMSKRKRQKLELVPQPLTSFAQLRTRYGVSKRLAENIEAQGYVTPTEVQLGSLPLLLEQRHSQTIQEFSNLNGHVHSRCPSGPAIDLLTVAPTGSGKTLAFLIPILNCLLQHRASQMQDDRGAASEEVHYNGPEAIIIAPTKELANQIINEVRKLTMKTGLKVALLRKGMQMYTRTDPYTADDDSDHNSGEEQVDNAITSPKAYLFVSTPLTMLHAIEKDDGSVGNLPSVQHLVLDEADVLLDPLFREQSLKIWSACTNPSLRVSLWSATMGASIEDLAKSTVEERWRKVTDGLLDIPARPDLIRVVVGLKDSAIPNVHQQLLYAATEQGKLLALRQLLHPSSALLQSGPVLRPPFLVFTQTISRAVALHAEIIYDIPREAGGSTRIAVLHSDLSDTARDNIMARFRKGEIWVLITTDLLSRGVDFRGINGVVNYDFPTSSAVYVHRVGRTGRAGREGGVAITLYAKEDVPYLKNVANVIAISESQRSGKADSDTMLQSLLESLPKPSKKEKKQLKRRGVETRRSKTGSGDAISRTRISTKDGYTRRIENNRKGVVNHNRTRLPTRDADLDRSEFAGFEDE